MTILEAIEAIEKKLMIVNDKGNRVRNEITYSIDKWYFRDIDKSCAVIHRIEDCHVWSAYDRLNALSFIPDCDKVTEQLRKYLDDFESELKNIKCKA